MHFWFSLYIGLNGLLITLLAANVSRNRLKYRMGNGDGGIPQLRNAIRAHGNAVEHCLLFALLVLALSVLGSQPVVSGTLVMAFSTLRVLHALSMLQSRFRLRQLTAGGTYLLELLASLLVLVLTLSAG